MLQKQQALEQKIAHLKQQEASQTQVLRSLKYEIAQANKNLSALNARTKLSIKEDITLEEAKLSELLLSVSTAKEELECLQRSHENEIVEHKQAVEELLKSIESAKDTLKSVQDLYASTKEKLEQLKVKIGAKNAEYNKVSSDFSDLAEQKGRLLHNISTLETKYNKLQLVYDAEEHELTKKTADMQRKLDILTAKSRDMAQNIIDQQNEQKQTAVNLGKWQKDLEERDLNLRIREQKAEEKENLIIRNSNLLEL